MSYGVTITNSQNHKIIQDGDPIYALKRYGTLSPVKQGPETGWYAYDVSVSSAEPTGTEEVFFEISVGNWIAHKPFFTWLGGPPWQYQYYEPELLQYNSLWNHSSNQSTLPYYVFDRMDNIPNAGSSTGYGMQVFNSNGTVCWDSNKVTNRVSKGGTVGSTSTNISSTANAISLRSWQAAVGPIVNGNRNYLTGHVATRTSTSAWNIAIGNQDWGWFARSPSDGTTAQIPNSPYINNADARYLLAYV